MVETRDASRLNDIVVCVFLRGATRGVACIWYCLVSARDDSAEFSYVFQTMQLRWGAEQGLDWPLIVGSVERYAYETRRVWIEDD